MAQGQAVLSMELRAGFDGFYKADYWTPVQVTIENGGTDFKGELRYEDTRYNNEGTIYVYPLDLPRQSRKQLTLTLPLRQNSAKIELVDEQGTVVLSQQTNSETLAYDDFLVGVVSNDPSLLNALAGLTPNTNNSNYNNYGGRNRVAIAHLQLSELPSQPHPWLNFDMLVFNDIDTSPLTTAQKDSLQYWISQGGQLVVGGGPKAEQTLAGLNQLMPFATVEIETVAHPLIELQNFLQTFLENRGPYVVGIPHNLGEYTFLLTEKDAPLIVSTERGLGHIHYIALDLSLAPLDTVAGHEHFLPKLLGGLNSYPISGANNLNTWRQMDQSITILPDQTLPTPRTVTLFLVLYVLAIGPLNYFILSRFKRRELAWLTLPLIIFLFCVVGYLGSFRLRGGQPLVRQLTVIRSEANVPVAKIASFIGVYSPSRTAYNLELNTNALVDGLLDNNPQNNLLIKSDAVTTIENLQADIGGMPIVMARSQGPPPDIVPHLQRQGNVLQGTLINNTGQPISHAYLLSNDRLMQLETLAPGENSIDGLFIPHTGSRDFYEADSNTDEPEVILDLASRDIALKTMLNLDRYGNRSLYLPGLYLIGWQENSQIDVTLTNHRYDELNDTLLMVGLEFEEN